MLKLQKTRNQEIEQWNMMDVETYSIWRWLFATYGDYLGWFMASMVTWIPSIYPIDVGHFIVIQW